MSESEEPSAKIARIEQEDQYEVQEEWLSEEALTDDEFSALDHDTSERNESAEMGSSVHDLKEEHKLLPEKNDSIDSYLDQFADEVKEEYLDTPGNLVEEEEKLDSDVDIKDEKNSDDGHSTDELIRMLGEEEKTPNQKMALVKSAKNGKKIQPEVSSEDEIFEGAIIRTVKLAKNVYMKKTVPKPQVPEVPKVPKVPKAATTSDSESDDKQNMQRIFRPRKIQKAAKSTTKGGLSSKDQAILQKVTMKSRKTTNASKTTTTLPKETASLPEKPTTSPNKSITSSNRTVTLRAKTTPVLNKSTASSKATPSPNKTTVLRNKTTSLPTKSTSLPSKATTFPSKATTLPTKATSLPEKIIIVAKNVKNTPATPRPLPSKSEIKPVKSEPAKTKKKAEPVIKKLQTYKNVVRPDKAKVKTESENSWEDEDAEYLDGDFDEDMSDEEAVKRPKGNRDQIASDYDSDESAYSLYDDIGTSDSEDVEECFELDVRAERATDYLPMLGNSAHKLLTEEKNRVMAKVSELRSSLDQLNDKIRVQNTDIDAATSKLKGLNYQLNHT